MPRATKTTWLSPGDHAKKWSRLRYNAGQRERPDLERYARGEKFDYGLTSTPERFAYGLSEAGAALERLGLETMQGAQIAALRGETGWMSDFNRATAYKALGVALGLAWHEHAAAEHRAGKRKQPLKMLSLRDAGFAIGAQLFLGQVDAARLTAERCRRAMAAGFFLDGDTFMPRRAQYFVVQLVTDAAGVAASWPPVAGDEPIYSRLRACCRDADTPDLAALLLAACERHVREARAPTDDEYPDFEAMEAVYFPFEVHAVLRLREQAGLGAPSIAHPLMQTALGALPAPLPPPDDPLLAGIERTANVRLV